MGKEDMVYICVCVYMCVCVCVCICIYIYEYLSVFKKNGIMPFAETWIDLEIITLSEVSQTEKDKYMILLIWNKKKKTCSGICLQNRNRLRDIENKLWLPKIKDRGGIN